MSGKNVLVIMSDEHTRSVMGAYGNSLVHTPTLDRLAHQGVRFDNAYTPSPICVSARASFATGTPVFENRCWSSAEPYYGQQRSWMHRLRDSGHDVVSIGKLHYRSAQDDLGFTEQIHPMYLANNGAGWPQALLRKPMGTFSDTIEMSSELGPGETNYTQYDRNITTAAEDWLHRQAPSASQPWVLFVSFICPHYPLSAPEEFFDLYRDIAIPKPYTQDVDNQQKHPVINLMRQFWDYADHFDEESERTGLKNYYGLCSFLDNNVSRVLTALEQGGHTDNTQIIYTSDHGDMLGNHGIWGKCYMYEDSVGIPMILSGAGIKPSTNSTPVSLTDIATTIEGVVTGQTNSSTSKPWQSRSLQQFIEKPDDDRPVVSEYHDGGSPCGFYMLRKGRWKLVYFSEGHPPLLFDMENDTREQNNLAGDTDYAEVLTTLTKQLFDILDPEEVNRMAFSDQQKMTEQLGGLDAIRNMASFNHTPVE